MANNTRSSAVKHLYAFEDGDTLTPGMGVNIESGYGLQQYYNPLTHEVIETDFSQHNAKLYPQAYSSKQGTIIEPVTSGQQWYFNNLTSEGAILQDGRVKAKFNDIFEIGTLTANGKTFPALVIKGNLVSDEDYTDKYIYYQSTYNGQPFTCQQLIPIKAGTGDAYEVLVSIVGADGNGDNVLSDENDWVEATAYLTRSGLQETGSYTVAFERLVNGAWQAVTNKSGITELSGKKIRIYEEGVDGVEEFRAVVTIGDATYYEVFQISDIYDALIIDDGCSHGSGAVRKGDKVTFNPQVINRRTGEVQTGWTFAYTFTSGKDGSICTGITKDNLTYENISKFSGIVVTIEGTKA